MEAKSLADRPKLSINLVVLVLAAFALALSGSSEAQTETVLYTFSGGADGGLPLSGVIRDHAGNFYGTAYYGGNSGCFQGCGVVYELSPSGDGWTQTTIFNFTGAGTGANPASGLVFDSAGNLYGVAKYGGNLSACPSTGCGVVYELSPSAGGWTETVIYTFTNGVDEAHPLGTLAFDSAGNLYGTAQGDGCCVSGTVFELVPSGGSWIMNVIHSFNSAEGYGPATGVVLTSAGHLFGTTADNQGFGGNVFEMEDSSGSWSFRVIHTFTTPGPGGDVPMTIPVFDHAGNLYGADFYGGKDFGGTVYELSPGSEGAWTFNVLYTFNKGLNGAYPSGNIVLDSAGNIYGVAAAGGLDTQCGGFGCGNVYELSPRSGGGYTERVLHLFQGNGTDGGIPIGGLVLSGGSFYGTTSGNFDGINFTGAATVFELTP